MNDNKSGGKRSAKSFYIALALSTAMVGGACWFAYEQTKDGLEQQIQSITDITFTTPHSEYSVAEVQTSIPKATTTTAAETTEIAPDTQSVGVVQHSKPIQAALEGTVIFDFSGENLVKSPTTGTWQTHNGVDIAAEIGSNVAAITSGIVTEVTEDALWGYCVTIDHENGIIARYCNLDADIMVYEGDEVGIGDVIGKVGNSADAEISTEPHLHLEITKNGSYVNPIEITNS